MTYYDEISTGYDELYGKEQLKKAKIIANIIKPKKNEILLDVGCGSGHYLHLFDCEIVGIDPSLKLLKKAKNGFFIHSKAEKMGFTDDYFDYVISLTAVQNFDDIKKGLSEIKRVAKDKVVISFLKQGKSSGMIENEIKKLFKVIKKVDGGKDWIYLVRK
ncbi:MAG: Ubiquinone/menaquinone biosynthesis C-methyltransferase UbiE [Candidatus Woesearchaeota archaeon]|nr:Ubiquinone/menaquinone biosynthesis C-methyltransferase UbiE [Candidatus Woesearchaeota archaeon]